MYQEEILNYYSRSEVQKAILEFAEDRELVPVMSSGAFGTRPNAVYYEKDVESMIKQGAVSFHGSVERWSNPLALKTEAPRSELDALRKGWDLIVDIDCDRGLEYSKKAALVIIKTFDQVGIENYSIKFSGNRGFHIGVPFEAFPAEIMGIGAIEKQYPKVPKMIIEYLSDYVKDDLKKEFKEDPDKVLKLDAAVAASRHLIRLPYCLHRKTWKVSLPIGVDEIEGFDPEMADAKNVEVKRKFLGRKVKENEALELLQSAVFWQSKKDPGKVKEISGEFQVPRNAIRPEFFPPCIKNILAGISDGRKRSVFLLIAFLHHIGWMQDDVEKLLAAWNSKNRDPLRDSQIKGGFSHQYGRSKPQMAPNCKNSAYYMDIGVCTPDEFCKNINNPVTYTLRKAKGKRGEKKAPRKRKEHSMRKESEQFEEL
ncbi:MAG: DNA primase small subunit domain-containing protein [archaeon]